MQQNGFIYKIKKFFKHSLVKSYLKNSFWMILARGCWIISALSIGIVVARKLGPRDFGIVNYVVAFVGIFSIFVHLGVGSVVTRDLINNTEKVPRILGNYTLFRFLATLLMFFCFFIALYFVKDSEIQKYCLIVSIGYIFSPLLSVGVYYSAFVKNHYNAFSELISCFVYNGLRLCAVLLSLPLIYYICIESLQLAILALSFFIFYCLKCGNPFRWSSSLRESLALILPALPLSMVAILGMLYDRVDTLMLKYFQNYEEVAYYSVATRATENLALFISSVFVPVFVSAVISGFKNGPDEYKKQLHRYYFLLVSVAFMLIVPSMIFGYPIIRFLYGEQFLPSVKVFYICVLTLIFTAINNAFYSHAINENRMLTILFVSLSGVIINIAINLYTIPHYAAFGAAISSLISMPLGFIFVLLLTKKGREDLSFILYSISHLPSFKFSKEAADDGE